MLEIRGDDVVIDIGYKSEGVIKLDEWKEDGGRRRRPAQGRRHRRGAARDASRARTAPSPCRYRKAKRQKEWDAILAKHKEGDVVSGQVIKKIKGGLLVNIGVNVFLPGQPGGHPPAADIDEYIDRDHRVHDPQDRRAAAQHRRQPPQADRGPPHGSRRTSCWRELEVGQIRKGVVKNIAEFGAFVDLGGIDGLLHITDMGWHRVTNPHDVVQIDQELEVYILHIDREKEKIALSLKHKTPSPWQNIEAKYPVGSRHNGEVVNIMPYGAFVKLEPGIEGLVHISEMSWVKRISRPEGGRADRRQGRGPGAEHQPRQEGNLARHEAVPGEPVGRGGQEVPAGHGQSPAWSAT